MSQLKSTNIGIGLSSAKKRTGAESNRSLFRSTFAGHRIRETAQKNEIRSLVTSTGALYSSNQELNAFVQGLTSETKLNPLLPWAKADPQSRSLVQMALIQLVYGTKERNLIEGHTDKVNDVSFSPDGKTIASVSNDGTIRLWSLEGKPLLQLLK